MRSQSQRKHMLVQTKGEVMCKSLTLFFGAFLLPLIVALPLLAQSQSLKTATGYQLEYTVRGQDANGSHALIIMHGKNASPEMILNRLARWGDLIAAQGFRVYVPVMPWSARWDGTHEDATSAIDALVELAANDGKKVFIGGHSMGAMFTLLYRPSNTPSAVVAKFVSAPGHMLDMIPSNLSFWADIRPSLERAQSLQAAGKGKDKMRFGGRDVVGSQHMTETYEMTSEIYLSWHDPKRLPSHTKALAATHLPVFWSVGENDPLIRNNASESTFRLIPSHPKSSYVLLSGKDHSSSFVASTEKLIPWMKAIAGQ